VEYEGAKKTHTGENKSGTRHARAEQAVGGQCLKAVEKDLGGNHQHNKKQKVFQEEGNKETSKSLTSDEEEKVSCSGRGACIPGWAMSSGQSQCARKPPGKGQEVCYSQRPKEGEQNCRADAVPVPRGSKKHKKKTTKNKDQKVARVRNQPKERQRGKSVETSSKTRRRGKDCQ